MSPASRIKPLISAGAALGGQLKMCRKAAGYRSQAALADKLGTSETVIAKAESGERPPTDNVYAAWMAECRIDGQLRLAIDEIWTLARNQEDPTAAQMMPWFELEQAAHTLRYWAPLLVPGPAQTKEYARELFVAWLNPKDRIEELVATRMSRRSIFDSEDGPDVTLVLWERILDSPIGDSATMSGQLTRLVELCDHPRVHVHILPVSTGAHMGLSGSIDLAATSTTETLLIDGYPEPVVTSDEMRVRAASATFNTIRSDALRSAESRDVLVEAVKKWSS